MIRFSNRVAVVTGAAGGIGGSVCRLLCEHGVAVAVTDLHLQECKKLAMELRSLGGTARAYAMDVTDAESVQSAKASILADFGKVDILVNNAGGARLPANKRPIRFADLPEDGWQMILSLNLGGVFRVTQAFLPQMLERKYGRIINLGSIAGEVGLPGYSDYASAKGGVILLTKSLAMEVARENITVNCVSPGMVSNEDNVTRPSDGTWVGRTGDRREIAATIVFLASDSSSFITGVDYTVDGGRILGPKSSNF